MTNNLLHDLLFMLVGAVRDLWPDDRHVLDVKSSTGLLWTLFYFVVVVPVFSCFVITGHKGFLNLNVI